MTRGKRLGTAFTIALCGFACGAGSKPSSPRPPGAPSVALSTLTVSPATVVADGVALARIDVEVRDSADLCNIFCISVTVCDNNGASG